MSDLQKHIDQIKSKVYNNSPAACEQLEVIVGAAQALDRYNDGSPHIQPIAANIVELLWTAHGSPVEGSDWPIPVEPAAKGDYRGTAAASVPPEGRRSAK